MKISTKGRYALRMLLDLAEHDDAGFVALKDIAERQGISKKYLEQIVTLLSRSGILRAGRGYQGGYKLAKPPAQTTVGEVLRVTEGGLSPVACLEGSVNPCERRSACKTLPVWQGLDAAIRQYLDAITLQTILEQHRDSCQTEYMI